MKTAWVKQKQKGFTIVELLIVIVVIAILATISIVAYSGIQTRARNATNIDTVRKYYKALQLYAAENGEYPFKTTAVYYCLGSPYPEGNCASRVSTGGVYSVGTASNNSTFNDLIRPYMGGQLPLTMRDYVSTEGGGAYIGAYYQSNISAVRYFIQDTSCPSLQGAQTGRVGGDSMGSLCQINLPEP